VDTQVAGESSQSAAAPILDIGAGDVVARELDERAPKVVIE
jgi:hypothetical protein